MSKSDTSKKIEKAARAGYRKLISGKPERMDSGDDNSEVAHEDADKGSSTYEKEKNR